MKYYQVHVRYINGFKDDYVFPTREAAEEFMHRMLSEKYVTEAYVIRCMSMHEDHEVKSWDQQCVEDLLEYIATNPEFDEE